MSDYSDVIDRATLEEGRIIAQAIEKQRSGRKPGLTPIGECHFCYQPFGEDDKRLFCDGDCASDHERLSFQQSQRLRRE